MNTLHNNTAGSAAIGYLQILAVVGLAGISALARLGDGLAASLGEQSAGSASRAPDSFPPVAHLEQRTTSVGINPPAVVQASMAAVWGAPFRAALRNAPHRSGLGRTLVQDLRIRGKRVVAFDDVRARSFDARKQALTNNLDDLGVPTNEWTAFSSREELFTLLFDAEPERGAGVLIGSDGETYNFGKFGHSHDEAFDRHVGETLQVAVFDDRGFHAQPPERGELLFTAKDLSDRRMRTLLGDDANGYTFHRSTSEEMFELGLVYSDSLYAPFDDITNSITAAKASRHGSLLAEAPREFLDGHRVDYFGSHVFVDGVQTANTPDFEPKHAFLPRNHPASEQSLLDYWFFDDGAQPGHRLTLKDGVFAPDDEVFAAALPAIRSTIDNIVDRAKALGYRELAFDPTQSTHFGSELIASRHGSLQRQGNRHVLQLDN